MGTRCETQGGKPHSVAEVKDAGKNQLTRHVFKSITFFLFAFLQKLKIDGYYRIFNLRYPKMFFVKIIISLQNLH